MRDVENKDIASGILIVLGVLLSVYGFLRSNQTWTNLGIAGIFLGTVVFTFKSSKYVKRDALQGVWGSYRDLLSTFSDNLYLEGKAIYIPPYRNLPRGGVFVPLHEDFDLDLARLDEGTVFLTDVPSEKQMGLLLGPFGGRLIEKYEEHFEGSLKGTGSQAVESVAGSVLRSMGLAKRVYIEEEEDSFRIVVDPGIKCTPENCERTPCPVCSSILLSLATATGELIQAESFERKDYGVEIKARKLGGVERWM
ncbi:hypothetical protein A3L09_10190 [Thermococcus profundus]|uniref:DUF7982 domain-containing protein n=1 Tax=Thermococcus profundus TaxID=49899 RepID=A0A2Z2MAI1_THEPR|nr:hypothetical protein [Thermococcus profundus]ASJ03600.1 hypothetical protein A3L09_10190 [Thermococcus profundus]